MKKQIKIYTIILAMVFWGVATLSLASSSEDEKNKTFLDAINRIRTAPFSYAIALEYKPEFLIARNILPDTRFDPYCAEAFLTAMAAADTALMTGKEVLATKKPIHQLTGETGGVVSFFNFMPRDTALKIVVDNLFRKELATGDFQYILSKTYSSAGVAISPGRVAGRGNAWFVSIHLGSAELVSEIQMLNLINQVRSEPWKILEYADPQRDRADIFNDNQDVLYLFSNEYRPLFFNAALSASARAYSFYQLNGTYPEPLGDVPLDLGAVPLDRAAFYGYEGERVQEYALAVPSLKEEAGLSVDTQFLSLIKTELKVWPRGSAVFLTDFQEVGSNLTFQAGEKFDLSVLSFVVGENNDTENKDTDDQVSRIYGLLFSDNDGNGLYSPGEELIQQTVTVYDDNMQVVKTGVTDNAGHFSMTLGVNKHYSFNATIEDVPISQEVFITSDQFVKMIYSPPPL